MLFSNILGYSILSDFNYFTLGYFMLFLDIPSLVI